jgi:hypothetical protein
VTVEFSSDGGATWAAAKPAYGNGSLGGLISSPAGTAHTFLWNSVDDLVGLGSVVTNARIRITPSDGNAGPAVSTANFTVNNTGERAMGVVSALFPHTLTLMGTQEMALGDLVAQAMKTRYGTQLAFQNGWGVRSPLPSAYLPANKALRRNAAGYAAGPPYDLVMADITALLPFGNRVVTRTVTGAQLWAALENGFSTYAANNNGFPQIAGFVVTFKAANAPGSRVQSVVLEGGDPQQRRDLYVRDERLHECRRRRLHDAERRPGDRTGDPGAGRRRLHPERGHDLAHHRGADHHPVIRASR